MDMRKIYVTNCYEKLISPMTLIRNLVEHSFDFSVYYDDKHFHKMVIDIVLGNTEKVIALDDGISLTNLWNEIKQYWLADKAQCK